MWITCKITILLWLVNLSPPLLALVLKTRWRRPVDLGCRMKDGRPLLGDHKTIGGVLTGIASGGLAGWLMGWPLWIGVGGGALSMAGDLLTSFIKRRLGAPSGEAIAGLDQLLEGALPLLVLAPYSGLGVGPAMITLLFFGTGAYAGSYLFKRVFPDRRAGYSPPAPRISRRWREWRACDTAYHPLHALINVDRIIYYHLLMRTAFRVLLLYGRGRKNARVIRLKELSLEFEDLPTGFDGYTILFLTDLHLDGLPGLTTAIRAIVAPLRVDLCLLGGDYRAHLSGPYSKVLIRMRRLLRSITAHDGIFGVLGNHDCIGMAGPLEKRGLRFLINDAVSLMRGDDRLWLVGVDDPTYYQAHDLEQAFAAVPAGAFSILLVHSPDIYDEAASRGTRLYLCGHTHAGQVQLPGIGPLITHSRAPREFIQGRWRFGRMQGYTSTGVGVSGVPVRFGTFGEVVLIRLKRKGDPPQPQGPAS